MSTLKTNNLEHLDAPSPNITLGIGGGVNISGIATAESGLNVTSGNIGIGTDNPSETLDVNGDARFRGAIVGVTTFQDDVNIGVGGTTAFFDVSTGRLGIGVNNPQRPLEIRAAVAALRLTDSDNNATTEIIQDFLTTQINNSGAGDIRFNNNGSEVIRIDSGGNVGIGTDNPAVALDVNGQIRASTGVLFGTDTAAANTLDDYEEGSFTPSLTGVSSYTHQDGFYVKIGSMVYFFIRIDGNAVSLTGNDLVISGLPFSSSAGPPFGGAWRSFGRMVNGGTLNNINFHIASLATSIRVYSSTTLLDDNSSGVGVDEIFILNGFYNTVL